MSVQAHLRAAADAVTERLNGEVIVGRAIREGDGRIAVDLGTATSNPYALEIIGITVLEASRLTAVTVADECPCEACLSRVERLTSALAILRASHDAGQITVDPDEARH